MLETILSGGQTGADQAGWRAAIRFGFATGGWMPKGYKTEDGNHPEYAALFGAKEHWSWDYPARTAANIYDADATVIFTRDHRSPGTMLAARVARTNRKPILTVMPRGPWRQPSALITFLNQHKVRVLNVAGNRESSFPDVGHWVNLYLGFAFKRLGFVEQIPIEPRRRTCAVSVRPTVAVPTVNRVARTNDTYMPVLDNASSPAWQPPPRQTAVKPKRSASQRTMYGPTSPPIDPTIKPPWLD